jgi:hypothetical protein
MLRLNAVVFAMDNFGGFASSENRAIVQITKTKLADTSGNAAAFYLRQTSGPGLSLFSGSTAGCCQVAA